MERLKTRKSRIVGASFLLSSTGILLTGCTIGVDSYTVQDVNTISACNGDQTPIEATFQGSPIYRSDTDPVVLAKKQENDANNGNPVGTNVSGNLLVGMGEVVCRSESTESDTYFITTVGAQVMATLKK
jgi:hypothetical protein